MTMTKKDAKLTLKPCFPIKWGLNEVRMEIKDTKVTLQEACINKNDANSMQKTTHAYHIKFYIMQT